MSEDDERMCAYCGDFPQLTCYSCTNALCEDCANDNDGVCPDCVRPEVVETERT